MTEKCDLTYPTDHTERVWRSNPLSRKDAIVWMLQHDMSAEVDEWNRRLYGRRAEYSPPRRDWWPVLTFCMGVAFGMVSAALWLAARLWR